MSNKKLSKREFLKKLITYTSLGIIGIRNSTKLIDSPKEAKSIDNYVYMPQPNKKALLVQQDVDYEDDIQIMNHLLKNRGYKCQILIPSQTTEKKVFSSIEQIAAESNNKSQTVFYYTGNGDSIEELGNGISVNEYNDIHTSRITPYELFEKLGKIKGKKAAIIDACHSGAFVEEIEYLEEEIYKSLFGELIKNYVVIGACPKDRTTVSSKRYIKDKEVGALTFGIYNLLTSSNKLINFSEAEILCGNLLDRINEKLGNPLACDLGKSFKMQRVSDTDFWL